jgi:hypothetical protein
MDHFIAISVVLLALFQANSLSTFGCTDRSL